MITKEQAYEIAINEVANDFPNDKVSHMIDADEEYLFMFKELEDTTSEILVSVEKKAGNSKRIHFMTAMIDYPEIDNYPEIDFKGFTKERAF